MTSITGSDTFFTNIDSSFSATNWEACIDQAIDKINGYARDDILPNMTGTAGSKTVSVTSGQAGFIRELTVAIYYQDYKNSGAQSSNISIGGLSSSGNIGGVEELAKSAADCLKEIDVSCG